MNCRLYAVYASSPQSKQGYSIATSSQDSSMSSFLCLWCQHCPHPRHLWSVNPPDQTAWLSACQLTVRSSLNVHCWLM
ncbi:hypothetical protein VFPPC_17868 [Pochonia chlamydosporia 170]|uniref:Uncharacterized protein n=1 Tax=Pochonia chlamydosporia 170 TaxID=1380566 RepID=A0A219AQQ0_METCM|nr:hypothetical protein VFPPC_17868 [Pochonia chlamydosporia 170]OWT42939.1 hypothetical protein VFPPC_17868 [Pochonia chlamydosporia 170]